MGSKKDKAKKAKDPIEHHPVRPADPLALAVSPDAPGFREKVTPKTPDANVFFYRCTCKGAHFRHAGYMQVMLPFIKAGGGKEVAMREERVMVCVACRKSFIWNGEQMYDVSGQIDLQAWEKFEVEAHAATGPGGEC